MSKRIAWITDPHFEFLNSEQIAECVQQIRFRKPEVLLISGDISPAPRLAFYLKLLAAQIPCPIYFVLGNHDYYYGSIAEVREQVSEMTRKKSALVYLSNELYIELTPRTALIGHDGWADARLGDAERMISLNDEALIAELVDLPQTALQAKLRELGQEAGQHFQNSLKTVLPHYHHVYVLTHVPPFRDAAWHEGQISDERWLPRFTCAAAGEALSGAMSLHHDHKMVVLCGHTHGAGEAFIFPNLRVITGGAEYQTLPEIHVFDVP